MNRDRESPIAESLFIIKLSERYRKEAEMSHETKEGGSCSLSLPPPRASEFGFKCESDAIRETSSGASATHRRIALLDLVLGKHVQKELHQNLEQSKQGGNCPP